MLVTVYICAYPGADRIFTTTVPPVHPMPDGAKLFLVEVELPGFERLDGVVRTAATPIDSEAIRLSTEVKSV